MPLVSSKDDGHKLIFDQPFRGIKMYQKSVPKQPGPVTADDVLLAGPVVAVRFYVGHNEYKYRVMERGGELIPGEDTLYPDTDAGLISANARVKILNKQRANAKA